MKGARTSVPLPRGHLERKDTEMGDVARVLASCNGTMLQSLLHDRLVIEACENIHLHWRNVRLEMSFTDAVRVIEMSALFEQFLFMLQGRVVTIPLAAIHPYDDLHVRVGEDDFENQTAEDTRKHKEGIAWMVEQIRAGLHPRPIAVCPAWRARFARSTDRRPGSAWQRLDGFKRYMAHKALGLPTIDCIFVPTYEPGCQHRLPAFIEPDEEPPRALTKETFISVKPERLSLVNEDEQRREMNGIELLRNGTIHVHLGDTRLEFTQTEFATIAEMFQKAAVALREPSTVERDARDQGAAAERMARI